MTSLVVAGRFVDGVIEPQGCIVVHFYSPESLELVRVSFGKSSILLLDSSFWLESGSSDFFQVNMGMCNLAKSLGVCVFAYLNDRLLYAPRQSMYKLSIDLVLFHLARFSAMFRFG